MPQDFRSLKKIYDTVYTEFSPRDVSHAERAEYIANNTDKLEFTYGEVVFEHYMPLVKLMKPTKGEVFWDIGCGGAKPVVIAAMGFPELGACKGVEFLPNLADVAQKAVDMTQALVTSENEDRAEADKIKLAPMVI